MRPQLRGGRSLVRDSEGSRDWCGNESTGDLAGDKHVVEGHDVPDVASEQLAFGKSVANAARIHDNKAGAGGFAHDLFEPDACLYPILLHFAFADWHIDNCPHL